MLSVLGDLEDPLGSVQAAIVALRAERPEVQGRQHFHDTGPLSGRRRAVDSALQRSGRIAAGAAELPRVEERAGITVTMFDANGYPLAGTI